MMKQSKLTMFSAMAVVLGALPSVAAAQDLSADLQTRDLDELRSAIQMRYDAALAATKNSAVQSADDTRYIWANEAKVQCAIALGYLKSNTRDETSISKCDFAYGLMNRIETRPPAPTPPPQPPKPPVVSNVCNDTQPAIVFFDFDIDVPSDGAAQTLEFIVNNAESCNWSGFTVVGHTDRAGSNAYNDGLSIRRANNVADMLVEMGLSRSSLDVSAQGEENPRVPTEDGVRSPQNRRVEVTVER